MQNHVLQEQLKAYQGQYRRCHSQNIHAAADRHADTGRDPQSGGSGQALNRFFAEDDYARSEKTDAADDLRRDTAGVESAVTYDRHQIGKTMLGNDHHQCTAQSNEKVGTDSGLFGTQFTFDTDAGAEHSGGAETDDEVDIGTFRIDHK